MKTAAIAVKYVEVMNGHLREMRRITRLLRRWANHISHTHRQYNAE